IRANVASGGSTRVVCAGIVPALSHCPAPRRKWFLRCSWARGVLLRLDIAIQPCPRIGPVTVRGRGGDSQRLCGFFVRQSAEIAEIHEARFLRLGLGKFDQSLV